MALIGRKYRYPKAAIRGGIHGKVVLGFVVENDGSVNEIRVIHDLGYGTGEEGVRVLNKASKWKPGYKRGVPVRVAYSLPIRLISP